MTTHTDVSFGPHPHQLIDIYLPKKGDAPFPALLWFGGIWKAAKHPANLGFFEQLGRFHAWKDDALRSAVKGSRDQRMKVIAIDILAKVVQVARNGLHYAGIA